MRIISGKFKGKRITAPKKLPVRPTTDMAKEALFNILNNTYYFNEINVLDLFSGTGNISYEFASRGSQNIISVDEDYCCVKFINTINLELGTSINAIKSDVFKFLEKYSATFDVIFADPPYSFEKSQFEKIIHLIFLNNLLKEGGTLIIEHSKQTDLSNVVNYSHSKKYGGNMFSFFELNQID